MIIAMIFSYNDNSTAGISYEDDGSVTCTFEIQYTASATDRTIEGYSRQFNFIETSDLTENELSDKIEICRLLSLRFFGGVTGVHCRKAGLPFPEYVEDIKYWKVDKYDQIIKDRPLLRRYGYWSGFRTRGRGVHWAYPKHL